MQRLRTAVFGVAAFKSTSKKSSRMAPLLLNAYLIVLVLIELPPIVGHLFFPDATPLDGFGSNLADDAASSRLWAFMLSLLVASRVVALFSDTKEVRINLALVHVLEAVYMLSEKLLFSSGGEMVIAAFIIANAIGFTLYALGTPKAKPA